MLVASTPAANANRWADPVQKKNCSKCGIEYQWSEALNDMACPNCWRRSIIYSKEWQIRSLPNTASTRLGAGVCPRKERMNTYVVEISNSSEHDWYRGMEGTRFEVYQGRKSYMVKQDDNYAENEPVRGIGFKDCEKVCVTCGHIESQHRTAGGFCKHCPCVQFKRRRTQHASACHGTGKRQ